MSPRTAPGPARAELHVGGVSVELRRSSKRRTVALRVGPGGAVLYAPTHVSAERLQRFLSERSEWLLGHLAAYARASVRPALIEGAALPLLGRPLTLHLEPGVKAAHRQGQTLTADPAHLRAQLEAWYRAAALEFFTPVVQNLARQLAGQVPCATPLRGVRLTSAGGRWGSCTASGEVRLHWRLMLAPEAVARYVAAHEAAHLAEMNHSAQYWRTLARLMPDYEQHRRWLRDHGETLALWD